MRARLLEDYRYERKFVMNSMNYPRFENLLLTHPEAFKEAYSPRHINNIYFDTLALTQYENVLAGNHAKRKYRIRWYGPIDLDSPITGATLEIKIKEGALNRKIYYPLPAFLYADIHSPQSFLDLIRRAYLLPLHYEELACLQPVLINRYRRKYHLGIGHRFRFTSDFDILFASPESPQHLSSAHLQPFKRIIVELKYARQHDDDAERITQRFHLRPQSISKFALGIRLCHY
ncbi:MAG: VTC domain-containing protein [Gallionella sp.]|nr:VTC domain-containing protein [Gallionella sp.]